MKCSNCNEELEEYINSDNQLIKECPNECPQNNDLKDEINKKGYGKSDFGNITSGFTQK